MLSQSGSRASSHFAGVGGCREMQGSKSTRMLKVSLDRIPDPKKHGDLPNGTTSRMTNFGNLGISIHITEKYA